jgi:glucokinase
MILAGDIGGTKTTTALFEPQGDELRLVREETFRSQEHASLEEILGRFLRGEKLRAACFGVAGPVIDGRCAATNLPWVMEETKLASATGAPRVKLLNDLEAMAFGMLFLKHDEIVRLNPQAGPRRDGNVAVIAAGTGLGEAMLFWDGENYHPIASEGGHVDFAPRTDQEIELLRYLRARLEGRVSYERLLSGPGVHTIYEFLREQGTPPEAPAFAAELAAAADPSVLVSQAGIEGRDPLAVAALDLFCTLYGAEAGNLALKCLALGGVFVGGGIAPKILPALQRGSFLEAFCDKGRLSPLLESLPVAVGLNPRTPLIGAAHYGQRMVGTKG